MLDIKFIRENKAIVQSAIKNKKVKDPVDLNKLLEVHDKKVELQQALDEINAKRNEAARDRDIEAGKTLKEEGAQIEEKKKKVDKEFVKLMLQIPNIPSPDTPVGKDDSENVVVRQKGEKPEFSFTPKAHWDLGTELDIIDNERAAKTSGARFTFLKGDLALLQFALIQYALSIVTNEETLKTIAKEAGLEVSTKPFIPIIPPSMVRPEVFNRMGRLEPKEDKYHVDEDDLYLVGSAEHTLGPMHMDEVLDEGDLPIRYIGYGTAYRREAGTYGKDTKGILRQHQFDKMEMETFCAPETSYQEQDFLVAIQEHLMTSLKIPYQVVQICTGDMGIPTHRQVDIESWMPGQDKYRETHTSDLIGSFQPRRLNTKVKRYTGKKEIVHMNDATLAAMGRTLIAIMENYQQEDGNIKVPEVLVPYMGGKTLIEKTT